MARARQVHHGCEPDFVHACVMDELSHTTSLIMRVDEELNMHVLFSHEHQWLALSALGTWRWEAYQKDILSDVARGSHPRIQHKRGGRGCEFEKLL